MRVSGNQTAPRQRAAVHRLGGLGTPLTQEQSLHPVSAVDRGRDEIDALDQEGMLTLAVLAQVQRNRPLDERVLEARDRV